MIKKLFILLLLLIVIFSYFFYNKTTEKSSVSSLSHSAISNIEKFTFRSLDNKTFTLNIAKEKLIVDGFQDKIVFIKVFGWECKFCQKEIPELIELKNQFSDTFDVIALESQHHSDAENRREMKNHKINYHIVSGEGHEDFYAYLKQVYQWKGVIPLTIIIGEGGEVLAFEEGSKSYTLAGLLKMALEQRAISKQMKQ